MSGRRLSDLFGRQTAQSVAAGALAGDSASRILPWATALMTFLAALSLAAALAVGDAASRWSAGFGGGLTVQLGPAPAAGADDPKARVIAMLRATPAVESVTETPAKEIDRLLAPWLGGLVEIDDLPRPRFLDATLAPDVPVDAALLEARLRDADPDVKVDDHEIWAGRLSAYARAVARTAFAAAILIGLISAAGVGAMAAARMAIHQDAIRLMRLLGATDAWIAGLIARSALRQGLLGGAIGVVAALVATALVEQAAADAQGLLPTPRLASWHWGALAALPLVAGGVSVAAARLAAGRWLKLRR